MLRAQDRTWHLTLAACLRIGAADMSASCPITPDLRQEPGAGKPHAGICAGGREQSLSLPRPGLRSGASDLREKPPKGGVELFGIPWILSSEMSLFNGLWARPGPKKIFEALWLRRGRFLATGFARFALEHRVFVVRREVLGRPVELVEQLLAVVLGIGERLGQDALMLVEPVDQLDQRA